jgi:dihydroorotate dehydrogenase electron transfer subunit
MMRAVVDIARKHDVPCLVSVEGEMACGIGVCLGCAIPARSRPYRYVCSNGPVFDAADVLDVGKGEPPRPAEACLPTVRGA